MNKIFVLIFLGIVSSGCNSKEKAEENKQEIEQANVPPAGTKVYNVPESLYGYYVNVKYVESLKKTKSTKESQEVSPLSVVNIAKAGNSSLLTTFWNFHESGDSDPLYMISDNEAIIKDEAESKKKFELHIKPNGIIVVKQGNEEFTLEKFEIQNSGAEAAIVNKTLFEGKYKLGNQLVRLTTKGEILGLDSLKTYVVNTDYIDAGMDFDLIYLNFKGREKKEGEGLGEEFGYAFRNDTLEIFRLNCLKYDPDNNDFCIEHSKGKAIYKLIKQ